MKVVILAGGYGSRISEESIFKPKPLIEVGDMPILWHIMKIYSAHGFNEFVICLGYKGYAIKEYFANYLRHHSDLTFDFRGEELKTELHYRNVEPWKVTLVDTGQDTMTAGRVRRVRPYLDDKPFMLTYGDGVGNVDIKKSLDFHKSHGKLCTLTAVKPSGRFGALELTENGVVSAFEEKPRGDGGWINAGFFVMEQGIFDYIDGDQTVLEREPLEKLTKAKQLAAFQHNDFWHPMDTLRDKNVLDDLWKSDSAPWKVWDDKPNK